MGKIYFGNKAPKKVYWGSTPVKKIYYGSTLLWSSEVSFSLYETQVPQSRLTSFVNEQGSYKFVKVKVVGGVKYYDIYYADGTASTTGFTQWGIMQGNEYITQASLSYLNTVLDGYDPHAAIYISMTSSSGEFYYDTSYPTWTQNTAYAEAPLEFVNDVVYGLVGSSFIFDWVVSGYGSNAAKVYEPTDPKDPPYKAALYNEWYLSRTPISISYEDFIEGTTPVSSVLPGGTEDFIVVHKGGSTPIQVYIII